MLSQKRDVVVSTVPRVYCKDKGNLFEYYRIITINTSNNTINNNTIIQGDIIWCKFREELALLTAEIAGQTNTHSHLFFLRIIL